MSSASICHPVSGVIRRAGFAVSVLALLFATASVSAQNTIKIGAVYSLSGPASFIGVPEERALRMRVEELNKAGGIYGKKVELVVYDTEGNTTKAAQQARRLIDSDNALVVFGPSSSGESLLVGPIANEAKIPLISHAGTEKMIMPVTPWVFNTPPTDRIVASHLLGVFQKRGITRIGLMTAADGLGQSGANVIKELAPQFGLTIVGHEEFGRQDPDITAQILKIKQTTADAMLIWSALPAPTIILKNARAIGYNKPIYNSYGVASKDILVQAGSAVEGTYVSSMRLLAPTTLQADDPMRDVVQKIYNDYRAKYNEAPATFVAHSYDAMLIVEAAVKKVQGPLTRESLRNAMEQVTVVGGNGIFRLSPQAHGLDPKSQSMVLLVAKGGEWKPED